MQDNTEPEGRGLKRQHEPSDDSEPLNKRFQATLNLDTDDTISEKSTSSSQNSSQPTTSSEYVNTNAVLKEAHFNSLARRAANKMLPDWVGLAHGELLRGVAATLDSLYFSDLVDWHDDDILQIRIARSLMN